MSHEFRMPDIGEGLTEAEIIKWFVAVGDTVKVDQLIVEVETAKTVVEIPSPFAGTITAINVREGETVEVGAVLFIVDGASATDPTSPASPLQGGQASLRARGEREPASPVSAPARGASETRVMPIVRKLAKEKGIDLATVTGSGDGGAITHADVAAAAAVGGTSVRSDDLMPLSRTRQAIADHMTESWTTIPHVTVQAEVRAEQLLAARAIREDDPLPLESLIAQAVIPLLKEYREFNAEYVDRSVAYKSRIDLGFAVDTEAGLVVVVVKDADQLSNQELTTEFERLATAAQDRTITLDEITGQTFTISNIGALGGGHGTPIIPLGTSAIVSIGRAVPRPVVEDGLVAVGLVAPLDLSYDHRLIDGSLGQRFLADLVDMLASISPVFRAD